MRILLTGGTGVLGRHVVEAAETAGHTVRVASRGGPPAEIPAGREWAVVELASGRGVAEAVAGVDAVVHAASDPGNAGQVDVAGTRALLRAAKDGAVRHVVHVSIVGVDRIPVRYYRHKLDAERVVAEGGVPFSILRATQFHPFLEQQIRTAARLPLVLPLPAGFRVQPVDPAEVARRLVGCVDDGPGGRLPDFGGPEAMTLAEAARQWKEARGIRKRVVSIPIPGRVAAAFRSGAATVASGEHGAVRWRDWLASHPTNKSAGA